MPDVLYLDTNALPVYRGLEGPLWLSVQKLCLLADIEIVVSELVVQESVNLRASSYAPVATRFLDAFADMEKFVDAESIYVPDASEIAEEWDAELRGAFSIRPLDGEDAAEALRREATRTRPARLGKGGRDVAVWLTALRLVEEGRKVYFVSNNTKDFGLGKEKELHPDLAAELTDLDGELAYLTSVYALVESIASKVETPNINRAVAQAVLGDEIRQLVLLSAVEVEQYAALAPNDLASDQVVLDELDVKRAYSVGDRNLVLAMGSGSLPIGDPDDEVAIRFTFSAWFDFEPGGGEVLVGEVDRLTLIPE